MSETKRQMGRLLRTTIKRRGRLSSALLGAACLSMLWSSAALAEQASQGAVVAAADQSMLVTTSGEGAAEPALIGDVAHADHTLILRGEAKPLEPISQYPERTPDLADDDTEWAEFGTKAGPAPFAEALVQDPLRTARAKTRPPAEQPARAPRPIRGGPDDLGTAYRQGLVAETAKFNGIQPGTSTYADVQEAWNEPESTAEIDTGSVLNYLMEPFESVSVLVTDDVVSAIKIELSSGLSPRRLAKQLLLKRIIPAVVRDDDGVALGEVYPERGVLFLYGPPTQGEIAPIASTPLVSHVVIQPLDANAFALRAEQRLHGPYDDNIHDLSMALSIEPDFAHAQWLLADIYLATGRADQAVAAADAACELEPENAAYRLRRAQANALSGRYDEAAREVRALVDGKGLPTVIRAAALIELARLATMGDATIGSRAIPFLQEAITLADMAAGSENVQERRAAKRLLVESHLAIAREIAKQDYANKIESVSQWVGRASGLAEDFIANDGGGLELRLLVAKEALAALASFKPSKDPAPFLAEAKQAAEALVQQWDDDLWQRRIQWELGQAYFYAVEIEHSRAQAAAALRNGQLAIENLADGAETRQAVHASERLVGELYFRIGAVHAVHKQDHKTAVSWYDKAVPLLTAQRPYSELVVPHRVGEQLVSIGLSYWQVGQKNQAVDLTLHGMELVQEAVDANVLTEFALSVPYSNLASMYQQLGERGDAAKFTELARSISRQEAPVASTRRNNRARPKVATNPNANRAPEQKPTVRPMRRSSGQQSDGVLR